MKVTPYDWRKQTIAGFKSNLDVWTRQRDSLSAQINETLGLIKALESVEMKRPHNTKKNVDARGHRKPTGKAAIPWQHRPGNEAKVAAWQRKMQAAQRTKRKAAKS